MKTRSYRLQSEVKAWGKYKNNRNVEGCEYDDPHEDAFVHGYRDALEQSCIDNVNNKWTSACLIIVIGVLLIGLYTDIILRLITECTPIK